MGHARHRGIVVVHAYRDGFRADHAGHAHHVGERVDPLLVDLLTGLFLLRRVVVGNGPRAADEEILLRVLPPRLGGAGHRVPAHVARLQVSGADLVVDHRLHGNDIGNAARRRVLADGVQDVADRMHRHGDNEQGRVLLGALEYRGEVIGDVVALLDRGAGTGRGVVIAVYGVFPGG